MNVLEGKKRQTLGFGYVHFCVHGGAEGGTLSPSYDCVHWLLLSTIYTLCQAHGDYQGIVSLLPLWQGSAYGVLLSWLCASTVYVLI